MAERPVRALRFTGFGLGWRWPIVNLLLEVMATRGSRSSVRGRGSLLPTMANLERYEWIDYKGRKRELIIHREIRE